MEDIDLYAGSRSKIWRGKNTNGDAVSKSSETDQINSLLPLPSTGGQFDWPQCAALHMSCVCSLFESLWDVEAGWHFFSLPCHTAGVGVGQIIYTVVVACLVKYASG